MKILLVAMNAKYIHSNLGVYSLKAYADSQCTRYTKEKKWESCVEIAEYTMNHQPDGILQDIYRRKPDVIGFSCYIWNIQYVTWIIKDLVKVLPDVNIWLGGPEVSYDAETVLERELSITGIMTGEGEGTFLDLVNYYQQMEREKSLSVSEAWEEEKQAIHHQEDNRLSALELLVRDKKQLRETNASSCNSLKEIPGITFRDQAGEIITTAKRALLSMDEIPFPYNNLEGMEHRIIYYESSRGCPYSCSYCLSSIDQSVRFRSLYLVKQELDFFLEKKMPQVKFVDRTFNCKKSHCLEIWKYLLEKDNGVTNFHFEISADLIGKEELDVLSRMRPGLIQLEIGVQTTNPFVIKEIRRTMNLERLKEVVGTIRRFRNIHQHLDLIAGLPYENFESFCRSFDQVYRMKPDQLQLGFLKVLKGSYMEEMAYSYGMVSHSQPPYEVLSTRWLDYSQLLRLKAVEEMVELYYNSSQFINTLKEMETQWQSPYAMFEALANYYEERGIRQLSQSRLSRYEILFDFLMKRESSRIEMYRDLLVYDLYLRENVKSRPGFARDQSRYKTRIRDFFIEENKHPRYLKGYEGYDSRQMSKMAHVEVMRDGSLVLFDYQSRDPLSYNARAVVIGKEEL